MNPQHQQKRKICQSCCHKFYLPTVSRLAFQLLAQMAHACFHGQKWVHTRLLEKNRTQRLTRRNRGAFQMGALSLPSEHSARSRTSPGRVSERRTLPLLGLGQGRSRRTQKAFGTAMRSCVSLFRGVAAPLGCATLLLLLRSALKGSLQAVAETAENTYPPRTVRI